MKFRWLSLLFVWVLAGCSAAPASAPTASSSPVAVPPSPSLVASSAGSASPAPSPSPVASPLPSLVGQWRLERTCEALVAGLTKANHTELMPLDIAEVINGVSEDGTLPATWDPAHPCADGRVESHTHTFWADGRFNSYDANERQVDDGTWTIVDGTTFAIDVFRFRYTATAAALTMEPIDPPSCTAEPCLSDLGWMYSVAYVGQPWTRVAAGPHVPPGSGG